MNCRTCMNPIHLEAAGRRIEARHDDSDLDTHPATCDDAGVDAVQHLCDQLATAQLALSMGGPVEMLLPILLPVQGAFTKVVTLAQREKEMWFPGLTGQVDPRLAALLAAQSEIPDDLSGLTDL